jgi:cyanophycinase
VGTLSAVAERMFGLLGSGEFEPWAEAVDRRLLERATGDGTVLILPAASAPEGDDVFDRWGEMGLAHYRGLGIPAVVVPLKTRAEADRPELADMLGLASMVFFSGGNPAYLAETLVGSRFWSALVAALDRGLAYAGCSAGVACLGEVAPDITALTASSNEIWRPGLRLFPQVYFSPHWDALEKHVKGLQRFWISSIPPDGRLVAIDERTAIVGDGTEWTVVGSGAAHLLVAGRWTDHPAGASIQEDLTAPS